MNYYFIINLRKHERALLAQSKLVYAAIKGETEHVHSHRATAVLITWSQKVLRLQELPKLNPN